MHRLGPFPTATRGVIPSRPFPMPVSNVRVCISRHPKSVANWFCQLCFADNRSAGTGPLSPEHGDIGLVDNLMSSHRVLAALLVFATVIFEIVTKQCTSVIMITYCGVNSIPIRRRRYLCCISFCLVLDLDSSMIFGGAADTRCNCIMVVLCCSTEVVRGPLVCVVRLWSYVRAC